MRLLLHIGHAKTGTTSLQRYLYNNREHFAQQGIYTNFDLLGGPNNRKLAARFEPITSDYFRRRRITSFQKQELFADFDEKFLQMADSASRNFDVMVISSEHLSNVWGNHLAQLRNLVDEAFFSVQICAYFRRQEDLIVPSWSQALKADSHLTLEQFTQNVVNRDRWNYKTFSDRWRLEFGREALSWRIFHERNWSTVEDFLRNVLKLDQPVSHSRRLNPSLSSPQAKAFRMINEQFQEHTAGPGIFTLKRSLKKLSRRLLPDHPAIRLDSSLATLTSTHFRQSNTEFFQEFFPTLPTTADVFGGVWVQESADIGS